MGKKKFFKKKDKFDSLGDDFKSAVQQSSPDEIRARIAQVTILDIEMKAQLKADPDVAQAKDALKNLMDPYREDLKSYRLQQEFMKKAIDDKGGGNAAEKSQ